MPDTIAIPGPALPQEFTAGYYDDLPPNSDTRKEHLLMAKKAFERASEKHGVKFGEILREERYDCDKQSHVYVFTAQVIDGQ